jgi:hypothetical protein
MANKIKKLKLRPSARDKRRYFLVRASNAKVEDAILDYIGVLGFAKSAYLEVRGSKVSASRGYVIGSCLVKSLDDIRAGLALAGMRIEKVSGTLRGLSSK